MLKNGIVMMLACIFWQLMSLGFAVVASKKIGNAVARNRAKRRLRAIFSELASTAKLGDYVIIAKDSLLSSKYSQASKNIRWALKKIGALQ